MSATLDRISKRTKSKKVPDKEESESHWGDDRRVIIRPDVPGRDAHPEDSVIIETDRERAIVRDALDEIYAEVQEVVKRRALDMSESEPSGKE
jgi:hypothetical protein